MTLSELQTEVGEWAERNFAPYTANYPLIGLMEELGELAGSHLKQLEAIRGTEQEHEAKAQDAVGDIVIFLANYCHKRGFDLEKIVNETWDLVRRRDWRKNPATG